jgi:putative addiction module killer protein
LLFRRTDRASRSRHAATHSQRQEGRTGETEKLSLRDRQAKARIAARIDQLSLGNAGDAKPVGSGVSEMRIDYGPGYRVYFTQHGPIVIVILCGGDKRNQAADIKRAIEIAGKWSG